MKMTQKLLIRPATEQDALRIAPLIRRADVEEWIALAPLHQAPSIAHSLLWGVSRGEAWYGEEESGAPVAIGGLCVHDGVAAPWLMATPAIACHGKAALGYGRASLRAWKERGLTLRNLVSARHGRALRYIAACGYELLGSVSVQGERLFLFGTGRELCAIRQ